jgi:hypothetical protein
MANRRLFQFRYSYERDLVDILAKVSFGATGAPTLSNAKGVKSIVRNSAGNYTITLTDSFPSLRDLSVRAVSASAPAAPILYVTADNSSAATPNIVIQFANTSGVATDPANGEAVLLNLVLKNAST